MVYRRYATVNQFTIGLDRWKNLKASYLASGLTTRVHGNSKRQPKNALKMDEIKSLVTFLGNYAEKNAFLLPGRIPSYKRDTIQLLPSKKVHSNLMQCHTAPNPTLPSCVCVHANKYLTLPVYSRLCGLSTSYQQTKLASKQLPIPPFALSGVSLLPTSPS